MSKIKDILKKKQERRNRLPASQDLIVNQLKAMGVLKIILFGSLAGEEVDVNSDLDLFLLMPSAKSGKDWMDIIYGSVERKVASDTIVFNEDEFQEALPSNNLLQNILKGRVLYEKAA